MSFDYNKAKNHGSGDSFWTSYSDLFLGLSAIFLLLYVVSSLRTGTDTIQQQVENQKLSMKVQDLENQLKMYDSIKKDYLEKSASPDEAAEYRELMDKLTLLQEEAKDEKEKLSRQALENESKEKALSKYQQMVRNIINANKMAKTKIANREDVIDEQDVEIAEKSTQLKDLEKEIAKKERLISEGERKINQVNKDLEKQVAQLDRARKQNKITAKKYAQQLAKIRDEKEGQIDLLRDANEKYAKELSQTQGQIASLGSELDKASSELSKTSSELSKTKGALAAKAGEAASLKGELSKAKAEIEARQKIAKDIKKRFAADGIKADIDLKTGDVVLDFDDNYFDTGSADLKPEMKDILAKAMPSYSRALFGDPNVAKQITSVEIVGFASPTYKGKYVDPNSTRPEDRQAIKYNMDLSYKRAKTIFSYVLDDNINSFEHHQDLVPLMKVSGRSFLEASNVNRNVASENFCKVNDCKKAQRVIIRFSIDKKK